MVARKSASTDDSPQISTRKTRIPVAKIRRLIKLKEDLDKFMQDIMDEFGVPMSYVRGLMKEPMVTAPKKKRTPPAKTKSGVKRKSPTTRKTSTTRKKKT